MPRSFLDQVIHLKSSINIWTSHVFNNVFRFHWTTVLNTYCPASRRSQRLQRHEQLYTFCASSCEADLPVPIAQIGSYAITCEATRSAVNPARATEGLSTHEFCCFTSFVSFKALHNRWFGSIPFAKIALLFVDISISFMGSSHDVLVTDNCVVELHSFKTCGLVSPVKAPAFFK